MAGRSQLSSTQKLVSSPLSQKLATIRTSINSTTILALTSGVWLTQASEGDSRSNAVQLHGGLSFV